MATHPSVFNFTTTGSSIPFVVAMIRIKAILILPYIFLLLTLLLFLHQLEDQIQLDPYLTWTSQEQEEEIEYEVYDTSSRRQETKPARKKSRLLCWILTGAENHMTKAIHVKRTWGSRCDILLFMSSKQDDRLGSIALPGVEEGRSQLWPKTQKALKYVWENHRNDADWFLKTDDDTFIFTGNLRAFLGHFDPEKPNYFGAPMDFYPNDDRNTEINAGGAGYVLSHEALRSFIEDSLPHPEKCYTGSRPDFKGDEDTELGLCLQSVGIVPNRTHDSGGKVRFFMRNPLDTIANVVGNYAEWAEAQSWSSDRLISFHYVKPEQFYMLEFVTQRFWKGELTRTTTG